VEFPCGAGFCLSITQTLPYLDFADDVGVCEDNSFNLEERMSGLRRQGDSISLHVSETKTKVMGIEHYECVVSKGRTCDDIEEGREVEVMVHWKDGQYKGWLSSCLPSDSESSLFLIYQRTHGSVPLLKICYDDGDVSFVKLSGRTGWLVDQDGDNHHFRRTGRMRRDGALVLRDVGDGSHICDVCGSSFKTVRGLGSHKHHCKGNVESLTVSQMNKLDQSRSIAIHLKNKKVVTSSPFKISNGSNDCYEIVNGFQYLGSWISVDSRATGEVQRRIHKACASFMILKNFG